MIERITSNNPLTKAIRIVLVFALVFWCSFRLESLAFAAIVTDDGSGHEDGTLANAVVRNADNDNPIASVSETASGTLGNMLISTLEEPQSYYIEPSWLDDSSKDDNDTLRATFFEWSSSNECVQVSQSDDGLVTVRGVSGGESTITCSLKSKYSKLVDPDFAKQHKDKAFEASFTVTVNPPVATATQIYGEDGQELSSMSTVAITPEQRAGYALSVSVTMNDGVTGEPWDVFSSSNGSLHDQTDGLLSDPNWAISDDEGTGAVVEDGVLRMTGPGSCIVHCTVDVNGGPPATSSITVVAEPTPEEQKESGGSSGSEDPDGPGGSDGSSSGPSPDPSGDSSGSSPSPHMVLEDIDQGEDHAQTELRVIVNNAYGSSDEGSSDKPGDNASEGSEKPSGESESSGSASSASANAGDNQASSQVDGEGSESGSSSSASSPTVGKTYSVDDLRELAAGTVAKYSLYGQNGWHTAQGTGPYLDVLLKDAGITDPSQIVSLEFESYDGKVTILKWDELTAARSYFPNAPTGDFSNPEPVNPMIAIDSSVFPNYVESDEPLPGGDEGDSSDSSQSPAPTDGTEEDGQDGQGQQGEPDGNETPVTAQADGDEASSEAAATTTDDPSASGGSSDVGSSSSEAASTAAEPDMVSNTRFRLLLGGLSNPAGDVDPDALRWINTIRVNLKPETPEPTTSLRVKIGYVPVPKGVDAVLVAIPNTEIGSSSFEFYWQYKTKKEGAEWEDVRNGSGDRLMVQTLRVPTSEETIGRLYRVIMYADDPETHERTEVMSDPEEIREGSDFVVVLAYDPPVPGDTAIFSASPVGADVKDVKFYWEMSTDGCETWQSMDGTATNASEHKSQLYVPTAKQSSSSSASSSGSSESSESASSKPPVITFIRVVARTQDKEAVSSPVLLSVQNTSGSSDGTGSDEELKEEKSETGKTNGGNQGSESSSQSASSTSSAPAQSPQAKPPAPPDPEPPADNTPPATSPTEGNTGTIPQVDAPSNVAPVTIVPDSTNGSEFDPSQVYVSSEVSEQVRAQKEEAQATTPGARWTEINAVSPSSQDVRRILADNPFAPFALPLGLGIAVAGGLEKLLAFRRQL